MNTIISAVKASFKKNFVVKINGFFVVLDTLFDFVSIVLFWAAMSAFSDDPVWSEIYPVFIGCAIISGAVSNLFVGSGFIGNLIISGDLDSYLLKPYPPMLLIYLERANFLRVFIGFLGGLFVLFKFTPCEYMAKIPLAILTVALAMITIEFLGLAFSLLTFKFGKVDRIKGILESYKMMVNYPTDFFGKTLRRIFTAVIPVSFVATVPTLEIYGKVSHKIYIFLFISLIASYFITAFLWKEGLKFYDSKN
ncbi:ABC-2 family transporter protein [Proteiniborus sp. MB09-C3]|uniref:ABC-2 family transporter protein n=1 Tax=Proteiniborus sp. MB09-C3 TaxID=3050072 RepID=UPI00255491A5|nr:ABC-2 family transporter protein [Proteiniborus sp. MB09-C3]WIV13368.1 ABC-2 family transporter protein [Proteiniborus sp. MB09-C3]